MSKLGNYLKEHLKGEILESPEIRNYFSRDLSPIQVIPSMIAFPADERDIRKINRFCYQLSERGRFLPITPRGLGSSSNGSSLGSGLIMSMSTHLNKINYIDQKNLIVNVQAGINFNLFKESMNLLGMELPFNPENYKNITLAGIISSNLSGNTSHKYGGIENCLLGLKVVLSNGEIIEVKQITLKEFNHKIGQVNFEGEVYRNLDKLIEDLDISDLKREVSRDSAMYNISDIKNKDGVNLIPLFIGSEGTLGVITEVTLKLKEIDQDFSKYLLVGLENNLDTAELLSNLMGLGDSPDYIEYFDSNLFKMLNKSSPTHFNRWLNRPYSKGYLLLGFRGPDKTVIKNYQKIIKSIKGISNNIFEINENEEISLLDRLNSSKIEVENYQDHNQSVYNVLNISVPKNNIAELLNGLDSVFKKSPINLAYYGNLAEGNLTIVGLIDVNEVADRQAYFKVIKDGSDLAVSLGGTMAANGGVGRLSTPYLYKQFTEQNLEIFRKIKKIFDPMNILNPDVKFNSTEENIKNSLTNKIKLRNKENIQ